MPRPSLPPHMPLLGCNKVHQGSEQQQLPSPLPIQKLWRFSVSVAEGGQERCHRTVLMRCDHSGQQRRKPKKGKVEVEDEEELRAWRCCAGLKWILSPPVPITGRQLFDVVPPFFFFSSAFLWSPPPLTFLSPDAALSSHTPHLHTPLMPPSSTLLPAMVCLLC